jgi:hypothetical protein
MKYMLLPFAILFASAAPAQDCTQELLKQKPGTWTETGGSISGIASADLAREKKTVAALHALLKSNYSPMGVKITFGGAYNGPYPDRTANTYYYHIMAFDFYCEGNTIKTDDETSTSFQISANGLDAEIYDSAQGDRLLAEGFNVMPDMPVEKDGYWNFKETNVGLGFGLEGKSKSWLITYDGKLPYSYVTKKEFLEKRKLSLLNQKLMSATGYKEVLKNIETEKKLEEAEYRNDPEKLTKYMKGYNYTRDRYEKFLAGNEKDYEPEFDKIEAQLKLPAEELNQSAFVKQDPGAKLISYLFTNDKDPFGKVLIKPNPAYFNKKLPRSAPQFFWVNVIWNHNDPLATKFSEEIIKAVDFSVLKNMLAKSNN